MQKSVKILFLFTELANYFLTSIDQMLTSHHVDVHIVRWPVNKEAPFIFNFSERIKIYNRIDYSTQGLKSLTEQVNPDIIYCSGWVDKGYIQVCKVFRYKIPIILGLDNHWKGSLKQNLMIKLSPFTFLKYFSHCWVPGEPQLDYAVKLGFEPKRILRGFYSADFDFFYGQFQNNRHLKDRDFPKRFIYVGRYYEFKGLIDLWMAFVQIHQECANDWELWCLGTGSLDPIHHPKIKHFGFIQSDQMSHYISQTGVFVLPSHKEPWGVVVHEFAAAGFPLICSNEIGAATQFLEEGKNGYTFPAKNVSALKEVMTKIMNLSSEQLNKMGIYSTEKAKSITPEKWAHTLLSILK